MCFTTEYASPLGAITLASDGVNLTGLWFNGQKYFGGGICSEITKRHDLPIFATAKQWLDEYFVGKRPPATRLPLAPSGGEFRQSVWRLLCEIPYGHTVTYGELARKLGCRSAQAIGGAVGHNPLSIMIPCHRVVGFSGSLTGYAGGTERKQKLLELEGAVIQRDTRLCFGMKRLRE